MTKPKYTGDYLTARKHWAKVVAAGEATCQEIICLKPTRIIQPGEPWDLCHDTTGTRILGPGHRRCNRAEGAARGNKARNKRFLNL